MAQQSAVLEAAATRGSVAATKVEPTASVANNPVFSRWHLTAAVEVADITAMAVAALLAFLVSGDVGPLPGDARSIAEAATLGVALFLIFRISGAYDEKLLSRPGLSSIRVVAAWFLIVGPLTLLQGLGAEAGSQHENYLPTWSVCVIGLVASIRFGAAGVYNRLSRRGSLAHTICVVGDGPEAQSCVDQARSDPGNIVLLGYLTTGGHKSSTAIAAPCLGDTAQLQALLCRQRVDEIVIATPIGDSPRLSDLIADLCCLPTAISIWPESVNLPPQWITTNGILLGGTPLLPVGAAALGGWKWVLKDLQDRLIAAILLIVCLPALLLIAITIRLCSRGPVLFRQIREGYCGREFRIFKFRSMHVSSSEMPSDRLVLTTHQDHRTYPFGAFLRRTSLDELPQLFNVLLGDMWLIGPRPHSPLATAGDACYAEVVSRYGGRHAFKPGITGWAQVNGWRGPTSTVEQIEQRVAHDLYYIKNWSPMFDLQIILMTAVRGFVHPNAF
jgi:Undecaprenyl-phosphate glucose phosphotransferase